MAICMTNGGIYDNIKTINGTDVNEMNATKIKIMLNTNDFIEIEFEHSKKAVVRTHCISSINLN